MRWFSLLLVLVRCGSDLAAEPAPVRITVAPDAIELTGARDRQGVIVQAVYGDESTRDVTASATFALDKPVASITNGFLSPSTEGSATLTVTFEGIPRRCRSRSGRQRRSRRSASAPT